MSFLNYSSRALVLSLFIWAIPAWAYSGDGVSVLSPVQVQGGPPGLDRTFDNTRNDMRGIPGNVALVPAEQYRQGAVMGLSDALSRTAGIYARNPSGQVSAKISIRGSGISASSGLHGIRLLRDGLVLGRADDLGDTIYADPFGADYIEVYRGANSLQYGAATLGGAINLVSPTGYTHPGVELRMEGGSHGYVKGQWRAGQVFSDKLDAFVSVSDFHADGFRQNSEQKVSRFYGNIGYKFGPRTQGRLHITSERYQIQMPGALTLRQVQDDPSQANADSFKAGARIRTTPRWHIAYQLDHEIGLADKLSFGVFHTGTKFDSPGTDIRAGYDATDYGASLRHEINRDFGGRHNRFIWGASYSQGSSDNQAYWPDYRPATPFLPAPGAQLAAIKSSRSSLELFAENRYGIRPDVTLVLGAQASWARRRTANTVVPLISAFYADGSASATYFGFNPKLGVVWDVAPGAQLFANASRSFEPPNSLEFHTQAGNLQAQRATTLELGTRGGDDDFGWDAAIYHSWLKDELLQVPVPGNPGLPPLAHNVDASRHLGLELGLRGKLRLSPLPGSLDWSLAYTWNHFRFDDDDLYGSNVLPGIPEHIARIDLIYRHPAGFYAGPGFELASSWDVDQANTLKAPGYGIVNFTIGYEAPGAGYRIFLDARNLADKYYAATSNYMVDSQGKDAAVFNPGQTRAVIIGLQANW